MRISVDTSVCVGAGQCAMVADELFDQDDDGIVMLLDAEPEPPHHDGARRAESLCPSRAIRTTD
jgi:ferredoxin